MKRSEDTLGEDDLVPSKKCRAQPWKYAGSNGERPLSLDREGKERNSEVAGPSAGTSPTPGPELRVAAPSTQTPSDRTSLGSPPESGQDNQGWQEAQAAPDKVAEPRWAWRGLPNLGNTCYMNAVLQALLAIPSFAQGLLLQGVSWGTAPSGALLTPLSWLLVLKDVCKVETKQELLLSIKSAISAAAEAFQGSQQNDAHEFLGQCLQQLKGEFEDLKASWSAGGEAGGEAGGDPAPELCAGSPATQASHCPVSANFEFEMQISITCQVCGWVVLKTEPSNHLSLDLYRGTEPPPLSVQTALDLFFAAEELQYRCERCQHRRSVLRCWFGRLPRVLIVHLKRYSFDDAWLLVKNDQRVHVSPSLVLSQCSADTKPPLPVVRRAPAGDAKVLHAVSQETLSAVTSPSLPSETQSSASRGPRGVQSTRGGAGRTQGQGGLESELTDPGGRAPERGQATADSAAAQEGHPLPHEDRGEPVSTPSSVLAQVPRNPELQNSEKTNSGGVQGCPEKDMSGPTEARLQEADQDVCGASGSDRGPGNQGRIAQARTPDAVGSGGPPPAYRLVSVVSHVGSSDSGHYISDVFDFQQQAWFLYNDLKVSQIPEAVMWEARKRTGYLFFYMHNEIFEESLEKTASPQKLSAQTETTPWADSEETPWDNL
ncbi:ubiquitin carboxyl-terminal hydrolase 29 [Callospermophilus lateralis]|uniref:ubiquitin carboxyl-terminal hydrolase 29 n=1 Tax=Callospermophilus lateralis TaxID=76772 RepID=UPI004053E20F